MYVEISDLDKLGISNENLNLQETTVQASISNERLYRAGCLAKWIDNNKIEYVGRKNQSISIRGCHGNLNEIELLLLQREEVSEAKVIQKLGNNDKKYICAYYTSCGDISISELKEYISQIVPDYMIPNYFIKIDNMPMNNDGTLNEDELQSPNKSMNIESEIKEIEAKVLVIWKNVLELEDIKLDDDFFDLGGHSILAIKLEAELEKGGMGLPSSEIYNFRTISEQAAQIWNNI